MERISLDTFTERMLLKHTQELRMFIPYDIFLRIDAIVKEAISQHYIWRHKIEELMNLLQELEVKANREEHEKSRPSSKNSIIDSIKPKNQKQEAFYYQQYDFDVIKYKRIFDAMLTEECKVDKEDKKTKNKGITF